MRMIGNYLQIAVRILRRNKLLSAIEVCSLSLAFGFCILAYVLVSHEWSYDRFHEIGARLYRVVLNSKFSDYERTRTPCPKLRKRSGWFPVGARAWTCGECACGQAIHGTTNRFWWSMKISLRCSPSLSKRAIRGRP